MAAVSGNTNESGSGGPLPRRLYVNFLGGEQDPGRVREAYGDFVYDRLVDVKSKYDPDNVFHHNQNIRRRLSDGVGIRATSP